MVSLCRRPLQYIKDRRQLENFIAFTLFSLRLSNPTDDNETVVKRVRKIRSLLWELLLLVTFIPRLIIFKIAVVDEPESFSRMCRPRALVLLFLHDYLFSILTFGPSQKIIFRCQTRRVSRILFMRPPRAPPVIFVGCASAAVWYFGVT